MQIWGLSDLAPTNAPSKKSHYRISWIGWNFPLEGNLHFSSFYFLWAFFSSYFFISHFTVFSPRHPFWFFFFGPLTPYYILATPTYLLPFFPPTHLPLSFCPSSHLPICLPPFAFLCLIPFFPLTSIPNVWEIKTTWAFGCRVYLWAYIRV